jgi:hypothetical protein
VWEFDQLSGLISLCRIDLREGSTSAPREFP